MTTSRWETAITSQVQENKALEKKQAHTNDSELIKVFFKLAQKTT